MTNANFPNARWSQVTALVPGKTVVTCTAFEFDMLDGDVNAIVAEASLANTTNVTIRQPVEFLGPNTFHLNEDFDTFALAVSFIDADGNSVRYVLHRPDGFTLAYDNYDGETIGADATLEIWGDHTEDTIHSDEYDLQLVLNTLVPTAPGALVNSAAVQDTQQSVTFEEI